MDGTARRRRVPTAAQAGVQPWSLASVGRFLLVAVIVVAALMIVGRIARSGDDQQPDPVTRSQVSTDATDGCESLVECVDDDGTPEPAPYFP